MTPTIPATAIRRTYYDIVADAYRIYDEARRAYVEAHPDASVTADRSSSSTYRAILEAIAALAEEVEHLRSHLEDSRR